jgi:hypothetical protein
MAPAIGSVAQLVSVIRSQLAAHAPAGKARAAGASNRLLGKKTAANTYGEENLGALIELRVRQIGRDDPQRGRKAFRVFLEVVLASHFGPSLINDPAFHQMVDDVQRAMEANADCGRLIDSAIAQLLAEK